MSDNTVNSLIKELSQPVCVDEDDTVDSLLAKIHIRITEGLEKYAKKNDLAECETREDLDELVKLFVIDLEGEVDEEVYEELNINLRLQTGTRFSADPSSLTPETIVEAESKTIDLRATIPVPPWRDTMIELLDCCITNSVYTGGYKTEYSNPIELSYYPYWELHFDQEVELRFLPDKDDNNPMGFLSERVSHSVSVKRFNGHRSGVTIPCLKSYGEDCVICTEANEHYNRQEMNGPRLWRTKSYTANVLIIDDPLGKFNDQICLLKFNHGIFNVVREQLTNSDMENIPCDYEDGRNFFIKKRKHGLYATYNAVTVGEED